MKLVCGRISRAIVRFSSKISYFFLIITFSWLISPPIISGGEL